MSILREIAAPVRFGLQFKLTALIVALITLVISALSIYVAREKKIVLTETAAATAKKELASLAFIASRAILDRDDLGLADSLQNAQGLPGFAVGTVFVPPKKVPLISRVGATMTEKQKDIERDALETVRAAWDATVALPSGSVIKPVVKQFLGDKDVKVQYFHKAVFHPFVKVNPPLLAIAQVAVTDDYINRSIRESLIELVIVGSVFFVFAFFAAFLLSRFIVKPVKVLSQGAEAVGKGNLDTTLPPLGSDELGALAKQFNTMTASLKRASSEAKEQAVFNDQLKMCIRDSY